DGRAILPKTYDTPRPTAPPASAAWRPIASRGCAHSAGVEAALLFPARADVWRLPVGTSREAGLDGSRTYRHSSDAREYAAESGQLGRRTCGSTSSTNI